MGKIDTYATPDRLYRYRSLANGQIDRELAAIKSGHIWCSHISDMNDPMEGSHRATSAVLNRSRGLYHRMLVQDARSKLGIASFSEVYDHEPMWAHYADQFRGICVSYAFGELIKGTGDDIAFVRMNYSENSPLLRPGKGSVEDDARMTVSTKTVRWSSEREWRLISPAKGLIKYNSARVVRRIYLGSRIDPEYKIRICTELKSLKIEVMEMIVNRYEISFAKAMVRRSSAFAEVGGSKPVAPK